MPRGIKTKLKETVKIGPKFTFWEKGTYIGSFYKAGFLHHTQHGAMWGRYLDRIQVGLGGFPPLPRPPS